MAEIQNLTPGSYSNFHIKTASNVLMIVGITLLAAALVIWMVGNINFRQYNDIIVRRLGNRKVVEEPKRAQSDRFLHTANTAGDDVMGGLDLLQLMTVAKTNPAYASVVADHADHLVERIIRLFDIEPSEMLRLLHATSGVISGSAVILALIPWTFEPGDLDLYVPKSQADYALRVIQDMFDFRQSKSLGPYLQGPSIDRIIWLEKGPIKLNLIVSSSDSAIEPIFHFHSTLVMNFISSLGIFCAYPDLTFKRRGVVNMGRREYRVADLATIDCIRKYQQRDFFLSPTINLWTDTAGHACTRDPSCPHTIRSIYDSGSLFYAFRRPPWMHTTTSLFVVKMTTSPVWCFGTNLCVNAKPTIGNFVSLADVTDENKNPDTHP